MKRDPYRTPKLPHPVPPGPHDLWDVDPTPTTPHPTLKGKCPHPDRQGRHEVYIGEHGSYCRACGVR